MSRCNGTPGNPGIARVMVEETRVCGGCLTCATPTPLSDAALEEVALITERDNALINYKHAAAYADRLRKRVAELEGREPERSSGALPLAPGAASE